MKNVFLILFFLLMVMAKNAFSVTLIQRDSTALLADLHLFVIISDDNAVGKLQLSDRAKEVTPSSGSVGGVATGSSARMRRVMTYSGGEIIDLEKLLNAIANKDTSYVIVETFQGNVPLISDILPSQRLTLFSRDARVYLARLNTTVSVRLQDLLIATSYVYEKTPEAEKNLVISQFCKGDYKDNTQKAIQYVVDQGMTQLISQHWEFLKVCAPQHPAVCPKEATPPPAGTQYAGTPVTIPSWKELKFELKGYVNAIERAKRLQEIYAAKINPEFIPNYFIHVLEAPEEAGMDLVSLATICKDPMPDLFKPDTDYPSWSGERKLQPLCEWSHATFTNPERFLNDAFKMTQEIQKEKQTMEQWLGELRKKQWGPEHSEFLRRVAQAAGGGSLKEGAAKQSMQDRLAQLWGGLKSGLSGAWEWIKKDRSLRARAREISRIRK